MDNRNLETKGPCFKDSTEVYIKLKLWSCYYVDQFFNILLPTYIVL